MGRYVTRPSARSRPGTGVDAVPHPDDGGVRMARRKQGPNRPTDGEAIVTGAGIPQGTPTERPGTRTGGMVPTTEEGSRAYGRGTSERMDPDVSHEPPASVAERPASRSMPTPSPRGG